jgi:hypothetical protein
MLSFTPSHVNSLSPFVTVLFRGAGNSGQNSRMSSLRSPIA